MRRRTRRTNCRKPTATKRPTHSRRFHTKRRSRKSSDSSSSSGGGGGGGSSSNWHTLEPKLRFRSEGLCHFQRLQVIGLPGRFERRAIVLSAQQKIGRPQEPIEVRDPAFEVLRLSQQHKVWARCKRQACVCARACVCLSLSLSVCLLPLCVNDGPVALDSPTRHNRRNPLAPAP